MGVSEKRRDDAKRRYELFLSERQAAATTAAVGYGPHSQPQRRLDEQQQKAEQDFEATRAELGDRPVNLIPFLEKPFVFWGVVLGIGFAEASFNRVVIEMVSSMPAAWAFGIAALVSAVLMGFAHLFGWLCRQARSEIDHSLHLLSLIVGPILLVIDLAVVLLIVLLRVYFSTVDVSASIDIFGATTAVFGMSLDLIARIPTDPDAIWLGTLNLIFLFLAALNGALSHDSERQYDSNYRTLKGKTAKAARAVDNYERRQKDIARRFAGLLANAKLRYTANGGSVKDLPLDDFKAQRFEAESVPVAADPVSSVRPITSLRPKGNAA